MTIFRQGILFATACFALIGAGCDFDDSHQVPQTNRVTVTEEYHGVAVTEEYRWLEDWSDPAVQDWTKAQNRYGRRILDALPNRDQIEARVTEILAAPTEEVHSVTPVGGKFFAIKEQPPKQQAFIIVFDSLDEAGLDAARILIDPNEMDAEGGTSIDWFKPSPDGSLVAVSLSKGGSESGDLHFFATESGEPVHEIVPRVNTGTAGGHLAWAADQSGVFYTRHPRGGERAAEDLNFFQQAWFHKLGTPSKEDRYELGKDFPRIAEIEFEMHGVSGQLLLTVQNGDGGEFAHYLRSPEGKWRPFSKFGDKTIQATFSDDGEFLYLLSRFGAPRGKVLRIPTKTLDVANAKTIVPEGNDTIVNSFYGRPPSILPGKNRLYLQYQLGGPGEIRVFDIEGSPQPGPKQFKVSRSGGLTRYGDGDVILFTQSSFTEPFAVFRFDPATNETIKTAITSEPIVDFDGVTVRREFANSKDGTKVPVSILFPPGFEPGRSEPVPALANGYGGYGISIQPGFKESRKILLEQGVIIAVANLRGGGEYGEDWHLAGNLTNKQNVFDDFSAVMNHLVDQGYTRPELLAIEGGSNGGLLMGAALTQHPDQMRCVVSHVGIYDMLRVELSSNGSFNIPEFGTVKNPDHFKALRAYSPYHNVKDGVDYPAVLFLTGVNDPRVDAMQSRKMTGLLQQVIEPGKGGPILLRTSLNSGHGRGTALDEQIAQQVDVHAFLFDQLGIEYRPPKPE